MELTDKYRRFFDAFEKAETDYLLGVMKGNFDLKYPFGYLNGILEERDNRIIELINDINTKIKFDKGVQSSIVRLKRAKCEEKKFQLINKIKEYEVKNLKDHISITSLKLTESFLDGLNFQKIIDMFGSIYDSLQTDTQIIKCTKEEYIGFSLIELLFEYYKSIQRYEIPENNALEKLYLKKGISLHESDVQYLKYGLLSITNDFKISDSNISKIYDKRIGSYVFVKEIPEKILSLFKALRDDGLINNIALRPEYSLAGEDVMDLSIALEELERGEIFSFENLGVPSITKLYTKKYDNLWIIIGKDNITFEEIVQEFDIYQDSIVTQVLHLEYTLEECIAKITHIDHEYIFYTIEEYECRLSDCKQKGNANKRFKTFKIDNSKIPFEVNGIFIIYYVLEKYFTKTELLVEYFQNVLET